MNHVYLYKYCVFFETEFCLTNDYMLVKMLRTKGIEKLNICDAEYTVHVVCD